MNEDTTIFGITNFRNGEKKFGIKMDDRRRHMYLVGKTGAAKTTVMKAMVIEDIKAGRGVCFVDPHGDTAEEILDFIPEDRVEDVIYFNPQDINFPIAFNPLEQVDTEYRHLVASGIMGVFKKIWVDMWSARMEYILNNTLLALLEYPGSTLLGIMRMLSDKDYRKRVVDSLNDPVVKGFWVNEFAKYSQKFETEATAAIQNKVGQFVTNPLIRNILGQAHSSIDMRKIMDEGKILIVNLSKGGIGEDNSNLLGAMIISKIQLAAMSRMNIPENDRRDFYLYVDEFQNFATDSFATILSEARKYHLCLIMAHQYIRQLISGDSTKMRDAVFGNVGTMISFRVGAEDAEFLEKEFQPDFMLNDFVNLPKYNFYIKLMIDGVASRPFSAKTIPPPKSPEENYKDVLIENSRRLYSTPRVSVEEMIAEEWTVTGARMSEDRMFHKDEHRLSEILKPAPSSVKATGARLPIGRDEPSLSEIMAGAGEPSFAPPSPKASDGHGKTTEGEEKKERHPKHFDRPEKKKVDIADLKKALEQSLAKNFGDEEEVKEKTDNSENII